MKRDAILWAGILTGPIMWFAHLDVSYTLASVACSSHNKLSLYVVSIAALLCTAVAGLVSWNQWEKMDGGSPPPTSAVADQRRSMAMSGTALSALFLLVIFAQTIANVLPLECG
jgi:hypothetical protein